ncbi:hypothetical protein PG999_011826 [Apiospora kogelbergensis]|uniref:Biotrophy-associated secreted protein 2 n=1 Tax=Apiospora kogelbergensis TaxID=1337665 RepID=A0AAW0QFY3_9PEZI
MVRISVAATLAFALTALAMPNHPRSGLAARAAEGSQNVGKGDGSQFITGQCAADADCASGCCAAGKGACAARAVAEENGGAGCGFTSAASGGKTPTSSAAAGASSAAASAAAGGNKKTPVSSAAAGASSAAASAAAGNGKTPVSSAAASASSGAAKKNKNAGASAADASKPGSQNVGKGDGSQFITGECTSDADCASGCCAKPKGVCSAQAVSNVDGKQGCGFTGAAA